MKWGNSLGLFRVALDDHVVDPEDNGSSEGFTLVAVLIEDVLIAIELAKGCNSLVEVMLLPIGQTT